MRSILTEDGFVGPFNNLNNPPMVEISHKHSMFYSKSDMGPVDMSPQQRNPTNTMSWSLFLLKKQKTVKLKKNDIVGMHYEHWQQLFQPLDCWSHLW